MAGDSAFEHSDKPIESLPSQAEAARPCLFLSHAGIDSAAAVALAERIEQTPEARRHGLTVWVDQRPSGLQPGTPWLDQLEAAIAKQSTAFALYLTKAGAERWVRVEVRAALDRVIAAGGTGARYPFIPLFAEDDLDPERLPTFARQYQGIHLANADAVQQLIGAMLERPAATVALVDEPFRGLEAFGAKDAHLFFGRDRETKELIERLTQTNLVMVVGDSGSGKSSLVKAGLVPGFKEGRFAPRLGPRPDPALWHVVEMRPLGDPFDSLIKGISDAARTLDVNAGLLSEASKRLRAQETTALRDALREGAPRDAQILLVVDQFEELWTLSPDRARHAFLDGLLDLAQPDDPSRRVVMTMRRDYYNLCSTHEAFFARIENQGRRGYYNLRRMDDAALRACIERPLALAGVPAAEGARLAEEVLRDAGDQPGDLALLEMALTESWQERAKHGGDLLASYAAIGRVEGAIRKAADEVYAALGERQTLAEPLFMRLVQRGDPGGTTRRVVHADEFAPEVWQLAQHLGSKEGKRLLVLGRDQTLETAELAHEQLVTQWSQYQRWLQGIEKDPRAADKRTLDQLMARTARWRERGRKWNDLATGSDLAEFRALAAQRAPWLAPLETSFVDRSSWRRRLKRGAMAATLLAVLAAGAWAFLDQRQRAQLAERQRIEAEATSIGFQLELPDGKVESRDVAALIALAGAGRDERLAFVDELFKRPSLAERFARNPGVVTRALVGLDPNARQEVITHAFGLGPVAAEDDPNIRYARALLGIKLTATEAIASILAAMQRTTFPPHLHILGEGLTVLAPYLITEQASQAIAPILAVMARTADPFALSALGKALAALPVDLTDEQARQAAEPVLVAVERTTDMALAHPQVTIDALRVLGEGLAALAPGLTTEEARQAAEPVLIAMARTADPFALSALGKALAALPVDLTDEQAQEAIMPILVAMASPTDPSALRALGEGLAALAPQLTYLQARRQAVEPVLGAMQKTTNPHALAALHAALAALPVDLAEHAWQDALSRVAQRAALAAVGRELDAMQPIDPDALRNLLVRLAERARQSSAMQRMEPDFPAPGEQLAALAPRLTTEQARQAVEPLLAAMQGTTDRETLRAFGEGLAALATKLTAERSVQILVDAMKIPWMAGPPSEPLLEALRTRLAMDSEPPAGLWDVVAEIQQRFGDTIDLTSPPLGLLAQAE